jgi:hypothetical protein
MSWKMFCQGVSDILNAGRLHRIIGVNPKVRFGYLLLPSREYISSGERAL